jgi:predicted glycosyltransferase
MARYLFSSHDGFGLGHTRRNTLIAHALLRRDPRAQVTVVTGVAGEPGWLRDDPRLRVVRVPAMVKDETGAYRNPGMGVEAALAARAETFAEIVRTWEPDVVVVDRHPYGVGGELRRGLLAARIQGAALVLGLRDVLDEPSRVIPEVRGRGWAGVAEIYTDVLVYGHPAVCDHRREYTLPVEPTYCGWVTDLVPPRPLEDDLLVVAAGGGGDGEMVYRLGLEVLRLRPAWRGIMIAGPYAAAPPADPGLDGRVTVLRNPPDAAAIVARAAAVIQMAGYNSSVEALASGLRPILVPRRTPRREQAIRAARLASLGLADVVDVGAAAEEVAWLLDRPRRLDPGLADAAGIRMDGAEVAARHIAALAPARVP